MTLNELIERLNWLKEDGVDGDTVISNIRLFKSYIQIEFQNGIISQVSMSCAGGNIIPLYKQVEVLLNEEQKQAIQYFIDDSDSYDRVGIKETKIAADLLRSILQK